MTGDVAVIQDADLEYDPSGISLLAAADPGRQGRCRVRVALRRAFAPGAVLLAQPGEPGLTLVANMLNDLNLTDMETCYKMVRADVLKRLRLTSHTFTFEPEMTCRLAQWGARIYEVPISYAGRDVRGRQEDPRHRRPQGPVARCSAAASSTRSSPITRAITPDLGRRARRYNRWLLDQVGRSRPAAARGRLGDRQLELPAPEPTSDWSGSTMIRSTWHRCEQRLRRARQRARRAGRSCEFRRGLRRWQDERLDTVVCSNVLEHLEPDVEVLRSFRRHARAGRALRAGRARRSLAILRLDKELGHWRRYTHDELQDKMSAAGFEIVNSSADWRHSPGAFRGTSCTEQRWTLGQMIWFDRLLPIAKLLEYCLPIPGVSLVMVGRKPTWAAVPMGETAEA